MAEDKPDPNRTVAECAGVKITARDLALVNYAGRQGGTGEVIRLDHPFVKQVIDKGLFRPCKLRAGPLGIAVDEPGITFTEFGRSVFREHGTKPDAAKN